MSILDEIVEHKQQEVAIKKSQINKSALEASVYYSSTSLSLYHALQESDNYGIIAEIKKKSPSKKNIFLDADPEAIAIAYQNAGASAISILTDEKYFGGSDLFIAQVKDTVQIPILRKEFIVDHYQVTESKALGADAILLICECLEKSLLHELFAHATELGLSVLLELYTFDQLDKIPSEANVIGINNRNLKNMQVDINHALEIANELPEHVLKVAESGISDPKEIVNFLQNDYKAFLIGEYFMKSGNPGITCGNFINQIKQLMDEA